MEIFVSVYAGGLGFLSCVAMAILMLLAIRNFEFGLKERSE